MNLNDMKVFVRTHADTDETDAPDSSLELYARAAYRDIYRRISQWVDLNTSDTLTTTASTAGYALSGAGFTNANLEYVTGIVGPSEKLVYVTWDQYLEMLEGPDVSYSTREALWYTVNNNTVYLYPTPSTSSVAYTVYGYRTFNDWPSGSTEPDLPREFDEVICWFMLAMYYKAQEDVELSQLYMMQYETAVNRFVGFQMRRDAHRPRILGGHRKFRSHGMTYPDWVRRNTQG